MASIARFVGNSASEPVATGAQSLDARNMALLMTGSGVTRVRQADETHRLPHGVENGRLPSSFRLCTGDFES